MKFVADEGVDGSLVVLLREAGFDVFYFAEFDRSTDDEIILELANNEGRILITRDKDFGELVWRLKNGACWNTTRASRRIEFICTRKIGVTIYSRQYASPV